MRKPLRPGLLRHAREDALAEFAGIGRKVEAFGLALQLYAEYVTWH
jgi:hypothetical protein